jgi:hypothetical protein
MTAYRVIEDHKDLTSIGQVTHAEIDTHISSSTFLVTSGSANVPPDARLLTTGSGVTLTDTGTELRVDVNPAYIQSLFVWNELPSGSNDGTNDTFTLQYEPSPPVSLQFFVNGVLQMPPALGGTDYVLSGSTIVMDYTPRSGSNLLASYPRLIS